MGWGSSRHVRRFQGEEKQRRVRVAGSQARPLEAAWNQHSCRHGEENRMLTCEFSGMAGGSDSLRKSNPVGYRLREAAPAVGAPGSKGATPRDGGSSRPVRASSRVALHRALVAWVMVGFDGFSTTPVCPMMSGHEETPSPPPTLCRPRSPSRPASSRPWSCPGFRRRPSPSPSRRYRT